MLSLNIILYVGVSVVGCYKTFSMLNSAEDGILNAHKYIVALLLHCFTSTVNI